MKKHLFQLRTVIVASALCLFANSVHAQNLWVGANGVSTTTNWSDANNWSTLLVPASTNSVTLTNTGSLLTVGTVDNVVDANTTIASLRFSATNGGHTT